MALLQAKKTIVSALKQANSKKLSKVQLKLQLRKVQYENAAIAKLDGCAQAAIMAQAAKELEAALDNH